LKRKRTVTITKVRRQTVTVTASGLTAWCPLCRCDVETVSKSDATAALQLAGLMLEGSERLHLIEVEIGNIRICKPSIISSSVQRS
jgi:hypothetical protein